MIGGKMPARARARAESECLDDYMGWIKRYPLLTPAQEKELTEKLWDMRPQEGQAKSPAYTRLRNKIHTHNLLLVVAIARRYDYGNVPLEDLVNQGNIGLMEAIERFEPHLGYKLSTYAHWWIRQSITRYGQQYGRSIRLPIHIQEKLGRVLKYKRECYGKNGKMPSDTEVAEWVNATGRHSIPITAQNIRDLTENARSLTSLNISVGEGEDELIGLIGDQPTESISFDRLIDYKNHARKILEFGTIDPKEYDVLRMRYGLGCKPMTLTDTGKVMGISRERVRQIQNAALRKLRLRAKRLGLTGDVI